MKSTLILSCLLGMSLAMSPQYRVNPDAPVPANPEEFLPSLGDKSLSIITVDAKGRVLKEEPITDEELKQIEEQLANQKTEPVAPEGRHPQNSQPAAPFPQTFLASTSPFFGPRPHKTGFRAGAVPASQGVSIDAIPQAAIPQQPVYAVPAAAFSAGAYPQYPFRAQPVYILNQAGFEGYGYQGYPQYNAQYPQYNPYRTFSIQNFPTTISTSPGISIVNPVGGTAFCKFNIFTQKTECYST